MAYLINLYKNLLLFGLGGVAQDIAVRKKCMQHFAALWSDVVDYSVVLGLAAAEDGQSFSTASCSDGGTGRASTSLTRGSRSQGVT